MLGIEMRGRRKYLLLTLVVTFLATWLIASYKVHATVRSPTDCLRCMQQFKEAGLRGIQDQSRDETQQTILTQKDILDQRTEVIKSACDRLLAVSNRRLVVTGNVAANISYCAVPKAGCTTWIRLLKYLNGQKRDGNNPMAISKFEVHYTGGHFKPHINMEGSNLTFIRQSFRTMTVRNPYTRLWSAYIDKFLLTDFWGSVGKGIIRRTRPNPSNESARCGHDVTFAEFIEYVIVAGHAGSLPGPDEHWIPASDICDPCLFHPHVIGTQETFLPDLIHVLHEVGLSDLISNLTSVDHVEYEIQDEINYSFKTLSFHSGCIDKYTLCKRLWRAFIFNGYIPPDESFPANIDGDVTPETFYDIIREVRSRNDVTRAVTKRTRAQALSAAYRNISEPHMQKLKEIYKYDFDLFGYNSNPEFM